MDNKGFIVSTIKNLLPSTMTMAIGAITDGVSEDTDTYIDLEVCQSMSEFWLHLI